MLLHPPSTMTKQVIYANGFIVQANIATTKNCIAFVAYYRKERVTSMKRSCLRRQHYLSNDGKTLLVTASFHQWKDDDKPESYHTIAAKFLYPQHISTSNFNLIHLQLLLHA